jgi:hypothetical protein
MEKGSKRMLSLKQWKHELYSRQMALQTILELELVLLSSKPIDLPKTAGIDIKDMAMMQ